MDVDAVAGGPRPVDLARRESGLGSAVVGHALDVSVGLLDRPQWVRCLDCRRSGCTPTGESLSKIGQRHATVLQVQVRVRPGSQRRRR